MSRISKQSTAIALAIAGVLVASSCGLVPAKTMPVQGMSLGNATLIVTPRIVSGQYRTLATVAPHTKASINHLVVTVARLDGANETQLASADLSNGSLDNPVTFSNLFHNTTYRVRCLAYRAPGTSLSDLISTSDANSYTDIVVGVDNRPTMATLKVHLIDIAFDGEATASGIIAENGGYQHSGNISVHPLGTLPVVTVAGSSQGYADGPARSAAFNRPFGIAEYKGTVYVADTGNNRIRRIDPSGQVTTFAGGTAGFTDGTGTEAQFNLPYGLAVDHQGNLYIADCGNNAIRRIMPDGTVQTLAGNSAEGMADGPGKVAQFSQPLGVCVDSHGVVFVADTGNNRIRRISVGGQVSTLAGGDPGLRDGEGLSAQFYHPFGVSVDEQGALMVADTWNNAIRSVSPNGAVRTVAGGSDTGYVDGNTQAALFNAPTWP